MAYYRFCLEWDGFLNGVEKSLSKGLSVIFADDHGKR